MATAVGQSGSGQDQEETCGAVGAGFDLKYFCVACFQFSCRARFNHPTHICGEDFHLSRAGSFLI